MRTRDVLSSLEQNKSQEKQSRWPLKRRGKAKLFQTGVDDIRDEATELRAEAIDIENKSRELSEKYSSSGPNGNFARRVVSRVVTTRRPDKLLRKMISETIKKSFKRSLIAEADKPLRISENIESRQDNAVLESPEKSNTKRAEVYIPKALKKSFINAKNLSSQNFRAVAVPVEQHSRESIDLLRDTEVTETEIEDELYGNGEIEEYNTLTPVESPALNSSDVIQIDESKTYVDDNDGKKENKCEGCIIL